MTFDGRANAATSNTTRSGAAGEHHRGARTDPRDAAIRAAIADGRQGRALELMREAYGAPLLRFAARMLGDRFAAEDVVQETLLRAFRAMGAMRPGSSVRAWVMTIAAHRALDELRQRSRQRRRWSMAAELAEVPDPRPHAPALLAAQQEARVLAACLDALPHRTRAALVLYFGQDVTFEQVGHALGDKGATVQVRVGRALRKLRGQLRRRGVERSRAAAGAAR